MFTGSKKLKWFVRMSLNRFNKILIYIVPPEKVKQWNARLLRKQVINLSQPQKLNEKILWLSYHTDTSEWSKLTDKYEVREYVKHQGLENILIPSYGIFLKYEDIPFESLPEIFVLKATHGCDMTYICKNKSEIDFELLKKQLVFWMKHNFAYMSVEMHYSRIKPRIICEKYLETKGEIIDYKFFCMNGKSYFVEVCTERSKGPYLDIFDMEWRNIPNVIRGAENNPHLPKKPLHFKQMILVAEKLAGSFPFVRIDLYNIEGKIYFGEMTFTPATGLLFHFKDEFLLEMGQYCQLPEI